MITQAAGFAVLAALSPTALLVAAVFLGAANPHRTVLLYLAGAVCMTVIMAAILFAVLRAGHLYRPHEREARYGLRLGLGLLMLIAAAYLLRRGPRRRDRKKQGQGLIARMTARPGPVTAFLVGFLVYSPSLTFVAAVQVVATSADSVSAAVAALALVVVITVGFVWLPLALFLITPERTARLLGGFNAWLRSHGHQLLVGALAIAGALLTINGLAGVS